MLQGIQFLGCRGAGVVVSVKIIGCQNCETVFVLKDKYFSSVPWPIKYGKIDGFDVLFDPFVVRKNRNYVVKARSDGPDSCFGYGGYESVECDGVTFHFMDFKSTKNETFVEYEQFGNFFFKPL